MPTKLPLLRLPVLVVLLTLSGLLLAGAAHAAPLFPHVTPLAFEEEDEAEEEGENEGGSDEGACEEAEEEFDEGELSAEEVKEICEEEKSSEHEAAHPRPGKAKHHRHAHKKACGHKRHCSHRNQARHPGAR